MRVSPWCHFFLVLCVCVCVEAGNGAKAGEKLNWQRWSTSLSWDDGSTVNDVTHNMGARVSLYHVHAHTYSTHQHSQRWTFYSQKCTGRKEKVEMWFPCAREKIKKILSGRVTFFKVWLLRFVFRVLFKFSQSCPCYTGVSGFQSIFQMYAWVCCWFWSVLGCCVWKKSFL